MSVVIPIIADVKGLAKGVNDTEKQLKRLGDNVGKAGASLTKGLTLPILGLAAGAVVAFDQVDSAVDDLAAKTGATGEAMKSLEKTFKTVAANATQGLGDVSAVVAELNRRLGLTGKPLEDLSNRVLTFARVTGIDAEQAAVGVTKAMGAMNVKASQGASFMDSLLKASQSTGIGVDALTDKIVKFGPAMTNLGFDTNTTIALLAQFEKTGVNVDAAMGGLRKSVINLIKDGVKDIPGALNAGIRSIKNAKTQADATAKAIELFGGKAGPDLAVAIRSGKLEVGELIKVLNKSQGTLDRTAEATEGPQEKIARLKNQVTLIGAAFAEVFIPVLEKAFKPLQALTNAMQNLSPRMRNIVTVTLAVVAVVGPMLIIIGKAITLFAQLRSIIIAVRAAQIGLNLAMIANPIGLVVVAVAALIAALVIAYQKSDKFRQIIDTIGRVVRDNLARAFEWLKVKIDEIWPSIQAAYMAAKPVLEALGTIVKTAVSVYIQAVSIYIRAWVAAIKTAYELISPIAIAIGGLIKNYITLYVRGVDAAIDGAIASFRAFRSAVISVRDEVAGPINKIGNMIENSIESAARGAKQAIRGITGVFDAVIDGIRRAWNSTLGGKGFSIPKWVPGLGGKSYEIPYLAEGGIVTGPTLAMIGEAGPEAVVPLDKTNMGGNTYNITVNAGMGTSGIDLGREIVAAIKQYERTNGNVFAGA